MTRMALAQKAGGGQTVSLEIETNQRLPTVATIARLASALSVSAGWLAYGLGDMMTGGPPATCDGMGARLAAVRMERGLTKAALARLVEVAPGTVADIEKGAQTGIELLEALAKALDVSPAWLAFNQSPRELPKRRRGHAAAQSAPPA
jgi:transcriptional regulator with XRE-family HTH domain